MRLAYAERKRVSSPATKEWMRITCHRRRTLIIIHTRTHLRHPVSHVGFPEIRDLDQRKLRTLHAVCYTIRTSSIIYCRLLDGRRVIDGFYRREWPAHFYLTGDLDPSHEIWVDHVDDDDGMLNIPNAFENRFRASVFTFVSSSKHFQTCLIRISYVDQPKTGRKNGRRKPVRPAEFLVAHFTRSTRICVTRLVRLIWTETTDLTRLYCLFSPNSYEMMLSHVCRI